MVEACSEFLVAFGHFSSADFDFLCPICNKDLTVDCMRAIFLGAIRNQLTIEWTFFGNLKKGPVG